MNMLGIFGYQVPNDLRMYTKVLGSIGEIIHLGNRKMSPSLVSSFCVYQIGFIDAKIDFYGNDNIFSVNSFDIF